MMGRWINRHAHDLIERVARAIAIQLGDGFDQPFMRKSDWIKNRGESGERFRDINEPYQVDYIEAARAEIEAMREPTPIMLDELGHDPGIDESGLAKWQCAIDAALKDSE